MAVKVRVRGVTPPGPTCGPSPDRRDGYRNIHAALQHRQDYMFRTPGDQAFAVDIDLGVRNGRFVGPYVHGRGDERFLYLGWGEVVGTDFVMFRRAKIHLDHLDAADIDGTTMEVEIDLSDERGHPTCASLRPPAARWRTADNR